MPEDPQEKPRHQTHSEESAHKKALQEEARAQRGHEEAKLRVAVDEMLRTPAGRAVMIFLFHLCGYNRSSIAADPYTGEVQTVATQHNEAMRLVYLKLRAKASRELLAPVEAEAETDLQST